MKFKYVINRLGGWDIHQHARIPAGTHIPPNSTVGMGCIFEENCSIGERSKVYGNCSMAHGFKHHASVLFDRNCYFEPVLNDEEYEIAKKTIGYTDDLNNALKIRAFIDAIKESEKPRVEIQISKNAIILCRVIEKRIVKIVGTPIAVLLVGYECELADGATKTNEARMLIHSLTKKIMATQINSIEEGIEKIMATHSFEHIVASLSTTKP